ncbi:fibrillin-3-like, partial [Sycon ciliatum]|uniref:fibrillin-3-like n=1 Tax=Sycon ciliatum TaxID=27933 RepID=UPI0031F62FD1
MSCQLHAIHSNASWSQAPACQVRDYCKNKEKLCGKDVNCTQEGITYKCTCQSGHYYDGYFRKCSDVDECRNSTIERQCTRPGSNAVCKNTVGSYVCDCPIGSRKDFINNSTMFTCKDRCVYLQDGVHRWEVLPNHKFNRTCKPGYLPRHPQTVQCGPNAELIRPYPTCVAMVCPSVSGTIAGGGVVIAVNNASDDGHRLYAQVQIDCANKSQGIQLRQPYSDSLPKTTVDCRSHKDSTAPYHAWRLAIGMPLDTIRDIRCSDHCVINKYLPFGNVYPTPIGRRMNYTCNHGSIPAYKSGKNETDVPLCELIDGYAAYKKPSVLPVDCISDNVCNRNASYCPSDSWCSPYKTPVCQCKASGQLFNETAHQCQDIDECNLPGYPLSCARHSICTNTPGSYTCACPKHWRDTATDAGCQQVNYCLTRSGNKCAEKKGTCSLNSTTDAGYTCGCQTGYQLPNCTEIDECSLGSHDCLSNYTCANTPGSYFCVCPQGYSNFVGSSTCLDIDECANGGAGCSHKAHCDNTPGSFTCNCQAGFTGNGSVCDTVDECALGTHRCHLKPPSFCINTYGSYACKCPAAGYTDNATACIDDDECSLGTHHCNTDNGVCQNTPGTFSCRCKAGFTGNGTLCNPKDPCLRQGRTCDSRASCTPNPSTAATSTSTASTYSCICPTGYVGDGYTCDDENECQSGTHQCPVLGADCSNFEGSYSCSCQAGFTGNGTSCENIDECIEVQTCPRTSNCMDSNGSYACHCFSGYSGVSCDDIDECSSGAHNCGLNTECVNVPGGFECECVHQGTSLAVVSSTQVCQDNDECSTSAHKCDLTTTTCNNTFGTYSCGCRSGYVHSIDSTTSCVDVNECGRNVTSCPTLSRCENTAGSFTCQCHYGYVLDSSSGTCVNINECLSGASGRPACGRNATCVDTPGSFNCRCRLGFELNGNNCGDVNECQNLPCIQNSECTNSPGSFSCACNLGFTGDGRQSCTEIDECASPKLNSCSPNADCLDQLIGHQCSCRLGYSGDGHTCQDINECLDEGTRAQKLCGAGSVCTNNNGSYTCPCASGYSAHADDTAQGSSVSTTPVCRDDNECFTGLHACDPQRSWCENAIGSYKCHCTPGYEGNSCSDVDECNDPTACPSESVCRNTNGSYSCHCNRGYVKTRAQKCVDDDECSLSSDAHDCSANATCKNSVGSFTCTCSAGFTGDGVRCSNIDECNVTMVIPTQPPLIPFQGGEGGGGGFIPFPLPATGTTTLGRLCAANSRCVDTVGSYECTCSSGYYGDARVQCNDEDECNRKPCDANANCKNTVGSFQCLCQLGYSGNGTHCTNVNECTLKTDNCPAQANCSDTDGSFVCPCKVGYAPATGGGCTDIDECNSAPCGRNAVCTNTDGSYSCKCQVGYAGTGRNCTNINECSLTAPTAHTCHSNATCTDSPGSYVCPCNPGFMSASDGSGACGDVNECNRKPCPVNGVCTNSFGSYSCACSTGYVRNGELCSNVDECAKGTHACLANTSCVDSAGSYSCPCVPGFYPAKDGSRSCSDVNECYDKPCHTDGTCTNSIGSFQCSCNNGYSGDGKTMCGDINECLGENCPSNSTCSNSPGSFTCACNAGFEKASDGNGTCKDVNECDRRPCHNHGTCTNSVGSFRCACDEGYLGNGSDCRNADECMLGTHTCDSNAACTDTRGSFTCKCNNGYSYFTAVADGHAVCTDVDECIVAPCHHHGNCTNTIGSFRCGCKLGFAGNGSNCDDVDECDQGSHMCNVTNQACSNTQGSYACPCIAGYAKASDGSCKDVNECNRRPCHDHGACTNNVGSFSCACDNGYQGNGSDCRNADECMLGTHTCDSNAACTDTRGSFTCKCNNGYSYFAAVADGHAVCTDVDECIVAPCHHHGHCTNIIGSFSCGCQLGFAGNGSNCDDVDECDQGSHMCNVTNQACSNTQGSYTCPCIAGYVKASDGKGSCKDVNECYTLPCDPNGVCTNKVGSFSCRCSSGYYGNGTLCTNIDECTAGAHQCHGNAGCTDTSGRYTCRCNVGYQSTSAVEGHNCTDVDECSLGRASCVTNSECRNTVASYTCECQSGYSATATGITGAEHCADIDECNASPPSSSLCSNNAVCSNTNGSFTCPCVAGYVKASNGRCEDVNECYTNPCDANGECTNKEGSFACRCASGYSGNGTLCTNIDECTTGAHRCDGNAGCTDTVGSYKCSCNVGYQSTSAVEGHNCTDVDECLLGRASCVTNSECRNTVASYTCECKSGYSATATGITGAEHCADIDECNASPPSLSLCGNNGSSCRNNEASYSCVCTTGFSGNGTHCQDTNECLDGSHGCHANATCSNTAGGHTCACRPGYRGSGLFCDNEDECQNGEHRCSPNAHCSDSVGSFSCACSTGYTGNGTSCTDVDECQLPSQSSSAHQCNRNADCNNSQGSYACTCSVGYTGNGQFCIDIDECALTQAVIAEDSTKSDVTVLGSTLCDRHASCNDTEGSYTCICRAGYYGNGTHCQDVDECSWPHSCSPNSLCANTYGSFTCSCERGFLAGLNATCNDVDECELKGSCDTSADCMNKAGSFGCSCKQGYTGNGTHCEDVDECSIGVHACDTAVGICTNTAGSFACSCPTGYKGNGTHCMDVDECESSPCAAKRSYCVNSNGSFSCPCNTGYERESADGDYCDDVNECENRTLSACRQPADCIDTDGSYTCRCPLYFVSDGAGGCDVQEPCLSRTHNCSQFATCHTGNGTSSIPALNFTCRCLSDFTGDGINCTALRLIGQLNNGGEKSKSTTNPAIYVAVGIGLFLAFVCMAVVLVVKRRQGAGMVHAASSMVLPLGASAEDYDNFNLPQKRRKDGADTDYETSVFDRGNDYGELGPGQKNANGEYMNIDDLLKSLNMQINKDQDLSKKNFYNKIASMLSKREEVGDDDDAWGDDDGDADSNDNNHISDAISMLSLGAAGGKSFPKSRESVDASMLGANGPRMSAHSMAELNDYMNNDDQESWAPLSQATLAASNMNECRLGDGIPDSPKTAGVKGASRPKLGHMKKSRGKQQQQQEEEDVTMTDDNDGRDVGEAWQDIHIATRSPFSASNSRRTSVANVLTLAAQPCESDSDDNPAVKKTKRSRSKSSLIANAIFTSTNSRDSAGKPTSDYANIRKPSKTASMLQSTILQVSALPSLERNVTEDSVVDGFEDTDAFKPVYENTLPKSIRHATSPKKLSGMARMLGSESTAGNGSEDVYDDDGTGQFVIPHEKYEDDGFSFVSDAARRKSSAMHQMIQQPSTDVDITKLGWEPDVETSSKPGSANVSRSPSIAAFTTLDPQASAAVVEASNTPAPPKPKENKMLRKIQGRYIFKTQKGTLVPLSAFHTAINERDLVHCFAAPGPDGSYALFNNTTSEFLGTASQGDIHKSAFLNPTVMSRLFTASPVLTAKDLEPLYANFRDLVRKPNGEVIFLDANGTPVPVTVFGDVDMDDYTAYEVALDRTGRYTLLQKGNIKLVATCDVREEKTSFSAVNEKKDEVLNTTKT